MFFIFDNYRSLLLSISCCAEECVGCQKCPGKLAGAGTNRRTHNLRYKIQFKDKKKVYAIIAKNKRNQVKMTTTDNRANL